VAPVVADHDPSLSGFQDATDEGPLIGLALGEKHPGGNSAIDVKAQVDFGLLGAIAVFGPGHGQNRVDEGAVDHLKVSEVGVALGKQA